MDNSLRTEKEHGRIGFLVSMVAHTALLAMFFIFVGANAELFIPPPIPPEEGGVLVALGLPDAGMNDDPTPGPPSAESTSPEETVQDPEPDPEPVEEEVAPPSKNKPATDPKPEDKKTPQTEDPEAIALKKRQQEEARKKAEEQDRVRREEDARKKAEADAKKKADDERAKRDADAKALKDKLAGGLGGSGKGSGSGGKTGNQGQPDGDPDGKALDGISTGTGTIGGGLGGRDVVSKPAITDSSQKQGKVVVEICVDEDGNVSSANYTQRGSNTSDSQLISLAVANAKRYKFSKGGADKQCGTITYNFKLQ